MKHQLYIRAFAGLIVLMLFSATAHAGPTRVGFHDTTIVGGTQIDYPVYVDSVVTGLGISAYQIEFTFNNSLFTFIEARSESTMTATWQTESNIISPGRLRVVGAGVNSLAGKGKLVILRFTVGIPAFSTYGYFTIDTTSKRTIFNQGIPPLIKDDGYVYVNPPPAITVNPNTWLMTKGETKQFTVSGGKAPYTWSSTNPSVASINDSTGLLTALSAGMIKVICVDSSGYADTSGTVEVRALALDVRDTSRYQGQTLNLPIYATDVTGLGIISGQFVLSYNANLWTPDSFITTGTMLNGWNVEIGKPVANQLNVVFSSSSPLSGSGVLLYIRMKATNATYGTSNINFINPFFNETILANFSAGNVTVTQLAPVNVTPGGSQNVVAGDSIQFSASGGTGPYTWTVSDTSRASISTTGWLKGKKSGIVVVTAEDAIGAKGNSGNINVFDFRLSVPDTSVIPLSTVDIPLFVTHNAVGFSSVQMKVTYTTSSYVQLVDVISAGTLIAGWSVDYFGPNGNITIAASTGGSGVTSGGTLLKLRFAVPDSTPRPSTIYVNLSNVVFNQDVPLPLIDNGYFTIANSAVFNISPASGLIQSSAVGVKDSATFTVRNTGTATLTSTISITGSGEFTLSTSNISVPPSDSVKVKAYYLPVNVGGDTATINFFTNDPFKPTVPVQIIGQVLTFPVLSLSTDTVAFGNVVVGLHKDMVVSITNTGTDTLTILSIAANNAVFTSLTTSGDIAPGNSVNVTLRFTPVAVTTYTARFLVTSNAASLPDTIHVSGTGISAPFPILGLSADSIDFGLVKAGQFKDTTVTITNTGTDTLKISSIVANNGVFTSQANSVNIAPGNSFVDTLRFTPVAVTTYNARFLITSNAASSPDTIYVTGIGETSNGVQKAGSAPLTYSLNQNYPNPFNPSTTIRFTVQVTGFTTLKVFDIMGKEVATLVNENLEAGVYHQITFNASGLSSGMYFYRLQSGKFVETKKMLLVK